jgi:serine/threonine protein kinase
MATSKPSAADLRDFLLGALPPAEAERIVEWTSENSTAADVLLGVTAHDALTETLLFTTNSTESSSPLIEQIIRTVRQTLGICQPSDVVVPIPERIGDYTVVRLLGRGGMGVVYEALDEKLHRRVALKVMKPELASSDQARQRFLREARVVAALKSDHIVTIYQVGETDEGPFLAMEYLEGVTLDGWMKDRAGPVSMENVFWIARDVLTGLAAAHAKGLVHRDIKPANLWVEQDTGRVKVLDFGLTRGFDSGEPITHVGAVVGTPAYMAPEQAGGKPLDSRADVFSVGVVLYWMLTGRSPFQRDSMMATLTALAMETPEPIREVHPELSSFIARLMAKDPADRPADAKSALAELQEIEHLLKAEPVKPRRRSSLVRCILAASVLFTAITLAGVIVYLKPQDGSIDDKLSDSNDTVWNNPQDALDASKIPAAERYPGQPTELVALLGEHRQREWSAIQNMALSHDGKRIAVCSNQGGTRIWDVATGTIHNGLIDDGFNLAFYPDSTKMVVGGNVWGITEAKPKKIGKLPELIHTGASNLSLTPDGRTAISFTSFGTEDGRVTLWDIAEAGWKLRHRFTNSAGFALSPNGNTIAVVAEETGVVTLYSLAEREPKEVAILPKPTIPRWNGGSKWNLMVFVTDDRMVTFDPITLHGERTARLWGLSVEKPRQLAEIKTEMTAIESSAGSKRICLWNEWGVQVYDTEGDRMKLIAACRTDDRIDVNLTRVVFTPDGKTIVTGHLNGAVRFWEVADEKIVERRPIIRQYFGSITLLDGRFLQASREDHLPMFWDLGGPSPVPVLDPDNLLARFGGLSLRTSPNGRFLAFTHESPEPPTVSILEFAGGKLKPWSSFLCEASELQWSQDSRRLACINSKELSVWDRVTEDPKELCSLAIKKLGIVHPGDATIFFPRADGSRLLLVARVGDQKWEIRTYSIADGELKELSRVPIKGNQRSRPTLSPNDNTLLISTGFIQVWDVSTDQPKNIREFRISGGDVRSLQFLADGRTIAYSDGNTAGLYDLERDKVLHFFKFPGPVHAVTASPDGRYLITGNGNGTIYVLRLAAPAAKGP